MSKKLSKGILLIELGIAFQLRLVNLEKEWDSLSVEDRSRCKDFYEELKEISETACMKIKFLIENMDKKVKISREKFEKFYELSFGNNKKHVQEVLLSEFGIETEEKGASDE